MKYMKCLVLMSVFLGLLTVSFPSALATMSLSVGNGSASPVNNLRLNFSWTNSTTVGTIGSNFNSTVNITFNLPTGIYFIANSNATNVTTGLNNASLSTTSSVIFGNSTINDTSSTNGWFVFNITARSAGAYTLTVNESYNINGSSLYMFNNTLILNITNGTITLTNDTFSNFTYNGKSITMNFTGTPSSATGGGSITDNITYNLYANDILKATNYTCTASTICSNGIGTSSYTNATADAYTFIFNTSGTANYTSTSFTIVLNISQAVPTLKIFINDVSANQTLAYLTADATSTTFRGNATLGNSTPVASPTFNMYIMNITQSSPKISLISTGNPATNSSTFGSATYQVIYNTSGNTNYTSASNSSIYLIVNKGSLILSLAGSNVRLPDHVTVTPTVSSTKGLTDVNFTLWRDSTLVSSALGSSPTTDTSSPSAATYTYILNTTAGLFANWTVNSTGVSLSIVVYPEEGNGGGGGFVPSATTTTIYPSFTSSTTQPIGGLGGGIPTQYDIAQTLEAISDIASNLWWNQTTFGVSNWQLIAIVAVIAVVAVLWQIGVIENIYTEITKLI